MAVSAKWVGWAEPAKPNTANLARAARFLSDNKPLCWAFQPNLPPVQQVS